MIHDPRLLDSLAALDTPDWSGTVWRHMLADYPPDRVNTTGARWNPPGVGAIYVSLTKEGALAEADYRLKAEPLRVAVRRTLYRIEVRVRRLLDLSNPSSLAALGMPASALTDRDMSSCRTIGHAVEYLEHDGLLIPSARYAGVNLVIYDRHRDVAAFEVAESISIATD